MLQGCVGNTIILDPLEFRQADSIEFGELVASQELDIEKGSKPSI